MQAATVSVRDDERNLTVLLASLLVAEVGQGDRDVSLNFGSPGCGAGEMVSKNKAVGFGKTSAPRSIAARRHQVGMVSCP
ncbi:MAG: hypothetical protein LBE44_01760 [Microbacterium hominis]|jgi:hypothetical protein|nr:hypothetical protein [Microbacterium hominis]